MTGLEYNEQNWKECLDALGFTESENVNFGGMVVYDDKGIPVFNYDSDERKQQLYLFLSGAVYWQLHTIVPEIDGGLGLCPNLKEEK